MFGMESNFQDVFQFFQDGRLHHQDRPDPGLLKQVRSGGDVWQWLGVYFSPWIGRCAWSGAQPINLAMVTGLLGTKHYFAVAGMSHL